MNDPESDASAHPSGTGAALRRRITAEIAKVYVGPSAIIDLLLVALLAEGHVLIEGVPGIAKTTLVKAFAQTLDCPFSRVQFTPDLLPGDITGTYVLNMKESTFELRKGPLFASIVLGDEINRAPAKTQSALLEAMQETQITIDGDTLPLARPFMVLATQNPIEQEGVYPLPEAQVDRFMVKVMMGYPTAAEERRMLATYHGTRPPVTRVATPDEVLSCIREASNVFVADELLDYIVRLVTALREHGAVLLGASPRASLALLRAAKAHAFIDGREHVLPDDIKLLAPAVLAHRLVLNPEGELDHIQPLDILNECVESTAFVNDL